MPKYLLFLAKGEGRLFWSGQASIDLSTKLSFTCGGNLDYYKSIPHPILTLPMGIENNLAIFKTNQWALLSIKCPWIFSSWKNGRGEKGLFWRMEEEGPHCEIFPRAFGCHKRWKSLSFCEIWNNPILSLLLSRPNSN